MTCDTLNPFACLARCVPGSGQRVGYVIMNGVQDATTVPALGNIRCAPSYHGSPEVICRGPWGNEDLDAHNFEFQFFGCEENVCLPVEIPATSCANPLDCIDDADGLFASQGLTCAIAIAQSSGRCAGIDVADFHPLEDLVHEDTELASVCPVSCQQRQPGSASAYAPVNLFATTVTGLGEIRCREPLP